MRRYVLAVLVHFQHYIIHLLDGSQDNTHRHAYVHTDFYVLILHYFNIVI